MAGGRTIIKEVPKMTLTPSAKNFYPIHVVTFVGLVDDACFSCCLKETGPTAFAGELPI